jgi:hypothetical protein
VKSIFKKKIIISTVKQLFFGSVEEATSMLLLELVTFDSVIKKKINKKYFTSR